MAASVATRRVSKAPVSLGFCLILCLAWPCRSMAADHEALKADAEEFFRSRVTPFIKTYCLHLPPEQAADAGGSQFLTGAQGSRSRGVHRTVEESGRQGEGA